MWLAGLVAFLWLEQRSRRAPSAAQEHAHLDDASRPFTDDLAGGRYLFIPLAVAGTSALAAGVLEHTIDQRSSHLVVALAWLLSLAALLLAATPPGAVRSMVVAQWARLREARFVQWAPAATIFGIGALTRFVSLATFPVAENDGLSMVLVAREVIEGKARDPFSTGWDDHPTFFAYMQAASLRVFGQSMFGARFVSAVVGTLVVVATFFWARRLFGRPVALAAAALIAVMPMNVYFSRVALNLVEVCLFLVLVLWFVDRAFVHRRPLDAVLAGLAIGLAQYFYFSARFLIPLGIALTVAMTVWWFTRLRGWRATLRAVAGPAGWMWAAALMAYLPLVVHFLDHPATFNSRGSQVTVFGPWLDGEIDATGDSEAEIIARQVGDAALLPFATQANGQYRPDAPLVGWPMAPPVAVGLAMVTCTCWRRRHIGIAMAWWGSLAAIALTIEIQAQRWTMATPLVAVCAALGVDALRRVTIAHLRVPARAARIGMVAIVLGLMAWNAHFVFRDSNETRVWASGNDMVADALANELAGEPAGTAVYTAFAPRMYFRSHSVVPFLAPQVVGTDLLDPILDEGAVPDVTGRTVFAFLPERLSEMNIVRTAYPNGTTRELFGRDGTVMITLYTVDL